MSSITVGVTQDVLCVRFSRFTGSDFHHDVRELQSTFAAKWNGEEWLIGRELAADLGLYCQRHRYQVSWQVRQARPITPTLKSGRRKRRPLLHQLPLDLEA